MLTRYGPWLAWGLVLWGVLQISQMPFPATHTICGAWGCGPPIPALLACHGAWVVILAPVAYLIPHRLTGFQSRSTGWIMLACGIVGILGIGVYELVTWLPAVSDSVKHYFAQRWAFSIVTLTDVPLLQLSGLGLLFVLLGRESIADQVVDGIDNRIDDEAS